MRWRRFSRRGARRAIRTLSSTKVEYTPSQVNSMLGEIWAAQAQAPSTIDYPGVAAPASDSAPSPPPGHTEIGSGVIDDFPTDAALVDPHVKTYLHLLRQERDSKAQDTSEAAAAAAAAGRSVDHALAMLFLRLGPPPESAERESSPESSGGDGASR